MRMIKMLAFSLALFSSCALAGPREDAIMVVERWAKAFTEADVDTIVGLYAPDAVFMGTGSKTIVTKPEDIRKYFQGALLGNRRWVAALADSVVTVVSNNVVMVTAMDKLAMTVDGKTTDVLGRVTFVVVKRDAGWKIVNFHRSAMPA